MILRDAHDELLPEDAEPMGPVVRRVRLSMPLTVPFARIRALLAEPSNMPKFHPLIRSIAEQPARTDGSRRTCDFEIDERIPWGFLSIPNRYRGRVTTDAAKPLSVRMSGWSKPGVRIEAVHHEAEPGRYTELIWFSAPGLVRGFVETQLVQAHEELLHALVACVAEGRDQGE